MVATASMSFPFAQSLLAVASAYALAGACAGVAFLLARLDRIDPAARNSYAFRALIFPGLVLLWPLVFLRWRQLATGTMQVAPQPAARQAAAHRAVWLCLAVLIPLVLGAAFAQRRSDFTQPLSVRLTSVTTP
jgi:hypothetical protein